MAYCSKKLEKLLRTQTFLVHLRILGSQAMHDSRDNFAKQNTESRKIYKDMNGDKEVLSVSLLKLFHT